MGRTKMIKPVGLDLGKASVPVAAMAAAGKVVPRRRLSRAKLVVRFCQPGPCLVGMAAPCGAQHGACDELAQRPMVRLMPAQYGKPLVTPNQHDHNRARVEPIRR